MPEDTKPVESAAVETAAPEGETNNAKPTDTKEVSADADATQETPVVEAPVVPEKYGIALPEGTQLNEAYLNERSDVYKAQGLTDEQAKAEWVKETSAADRAWKIQVENYEAESNGWLETLKNDIDVGGDKLPANAEAVSRLVDKYFDPDLKNYLDTTKMGNRPDIFKSLLRVARDMGVMDDQSVPAPHQPTPARTKSREEILYPTHYPEQQNN